MNTFIPNLDSCIVNECTDTMYSTQSYQDLQMHHIMANLQRHYCADFDYLTPMEYQFIQKNSPFNDDPVDYIVPPPKTRAYDPMEPGRDGLASL